MAAQIPQATNLALTILKEGLYNVKVSPYDAAQYQRKLDEQVLENYDEKLEVKSHELKIFEN